MKNLWSMAICACLSLYSVCASAQTATIPINEPDLNRPKMFEALPDKIPVSQQTINELFTLEAGRLVNIHLSDAFRFEGSVMSLVSKYDNAIRSIMIRSTNYPGARFSITKTTDERGQVSYTGRILNMQRADLYELKSIDNQLVLVKKKYYSVVAE